MKRLFLVVLCWLTLILSVFGQEFQRIQISAASLNNMVLKNGASMSFEGKCLDQFRRAPDPSIQMNHVLTESSDIMVQYLDNGKSVHLQELLGKPGGIAITGSPDSYLQKSPSSDTSFPLQFQNNTGRKIRLIAKTDIQFGEQPESSVETYGAVHQSEIWANTTLKRLDEMGYNPVRDISKLPSIPLYEKEKLSRAALQKFALDHETVYDERDIFELWDFERVFNDAYNKISAEHYRVEKESVAAFREYDSGIKGSSSKSMIESYKKANHLDHETSWDNVKDLLAKDRSEKAYYIFDKQREQYVRYRRSPSIPNMLYTLEKPNGNVEELERALFSQPLEANHFHVLNFLSPNELGLESTFTALNNLLADHHSNYSIDALKKLKAKIKSGNVKYVWCLGHFRTGQIFTYDSKLKKEISYPIKRLYQIGKLLGVEIIPLGCNSSFAGLGGAGTTGIVNSDQMISRLFHALSTSATTGQFFKTWVGSDTQKQWFVWRLAGKKRPTTLHVFEKTASDYVPGANEQRTNEGSDQEPHFQEQTGKYAYHLQNELYITFPDFFFSLAAGSMTQTQTNHKNDDRPKSIH